MTGWIGWQVIYLVDGLTKIECIINRVKRQMKFKPALEELAITDFYRHFSAALSYFGRAVKG